MWSFISGVQFGKSSDHNFAKTQQSSNVANMGTALDWGEHSRLQGEFFGIFLPSSFARFFPPFLKPPFRLVVSICSCLLHAASALCLCLCLSASASAAFTAPICCNLPFAVAAAGCMFASNCIRAPVHIYNQRNVFWGDLERKTRPEEWSRLQYSTPFLSRRYAESFHFFLFFHLFSARTTYRNCASTTHNSCRLRAITLKPRQVSSGGDGDPYGSVPEAITPHPGRLWIVPIYENIIFYYLCPN